MNSRQELLRLNVSPDVQTFFTMRFPHEPYNLNSTRRNGHPIMFQVHASTAEPSGPSRGFMPVRSFRGPEVFHRDHCRSVIPQPRPPAENSPWSPYDSPLYALEQDLMHRLTMNARPMPPRRCPLNPSSHPLRPPIEFLPTRGRRYLASSARPQGQYLSPSAVSATVSNRETLSERDRHDIHMDCTEASSSSCSYVYEAPPSPSRSSRRRARRRSQNSQSTLPATSSSSASLARETTSLRRQPPRTPREPKVVSLGEFLEKTELAVFSTIKNLELASSFGDLSTHQDVCAVCFSDFGQKDVIRLLKTCGHYFHVKCIDSWLTRNSNCPVCRQTLRKEIDQRLSVIPFLLEDTNPISIEDPPSDLFKDCDFHQEIQHGPTDSLVAHSDTISPTSEDIVDDLSFEEQVQLFSMLFIESLKTLIQTVTTTGQNSTFDAGDEEHDSALPLVDDRKREETKSLGQVSAKLPMNHTERKVRSCNDLVYHFFRIKKSPFKASR